LAVFIEAGIIAQASLDDGADLRIKGRIARPTIDDALKDRSIGIDSNPHPDRYTARPGVEQLRGKIAPTKWWDCKPRPGDRQA
jgi:hypothetical protein